MHSECLGRRVPANRWHRKAPPGIPACGGCGDHELSRPPLWAGHLLAAQPQANCLISLSLGCLIREKGTTLAWRDMPRDMNALTGALQRYSCRKGQSWERGQVCRRNRESDTLGTGRGAYMGRPRDLPQAYPGPGVSYGKRLFWSVLT